MGVQPVFLTGSSEHLSYIVVITNTHHGYLEIELFCLIEGRGKLYLFLRSTCSNITGTNDYICVGEKMRKKPTGKKLIFSLLITTHSSTDLEDIDQKEKRRKTMANVVVSLI